MLDQSKKQTRRSFQPQPKTEQEEMWYSSIPLEAMWGIYARQSTMAQLIKNAESTEMQTDDLIQLLLERGVQDGNWQLFDADLGLSGTLPIDKRTGLQELVEWIKAGKIKAVLVYQISRLFRDDTGVEYNTFAKICKEHNCVLMTADGMVFNFNNRMHLKMFRFLAEYAAEYIPQQIGLLQAARMRKARRGLFVGFGYVPRGYIVDYNKDNETYQKYIPYLPFQEPILNLFERFYALEGNLSQLCREVDALPRVFPSYESWVDKRNIRDQTWTKVPGGYHISRSGIISILTNPVYVGWYIVAGDVVSTTNHEALIPPEKQYLFWYAFDHLAEYTIEGKVNEKRSIPPRRFHQKHTDEQIGLLKDRIQKPDGSPIYAHFTKGGRYHSYRIPRRRVKVYSGTESEVDLDLIDAEFTKRLFVHLRQTHDFDGFSQWVNEVIQRQTTQVEIINVQLQEIQNQQEAILDEKLAIRAYINQQLKAALLNDPNADIEELRARFEAESAQELERLRVRSQKLDARESELQSKLPNEEDAKELSIARIFADYQTELEQLARVWERKRLKEKRDFVNLLVEKVALSIVATHWMQLTIYWTHPAWTTETLYIYRRRGAIEKWTDEEKQLVKKHYPRSERSKLLALLPHKSWMAIGVQAHKMKVRRTQRPDKLGIDKLITWSDYQFCQTLGIPQDSRETICRVEASNTKSDSPLTLLTST